MGKIFDFIKENPGCSMKVLVEKFGKIDVLDNLKNNKEISVEVVSS